MSHVETFSSEAHDIDKKPLKDYYVSLDAALLPTADAFSIPGSEIRRYRDTGRAEGLLDSLLPNEPYTIIVVPFGVGKTSLCKMIGSKYASRYLDSQIDKQDSKYIPVFVSLGNGLSVDYENYSLDNILKKVITSEHIKGSTQRYILLILDGLEEYDSSKKSLYEEIEHLRSNYSSMRIIITTRTDEIQRDRILRDNRINVIKSLRLLEFNDDQLTEFMQKFGMKSEDLVLYEEIKLPLFAWIYTLIKTELEEIRSREALWTKNMIKSWIFMVLFHSVIRGKHKEAIRSDARSYYSTEKHTLRFIAQQKSIYGKDLTLDKLESLIIQSKTNDGIKLDTHIPSYFLHITNSVKGKLIDFIHESFREYLLAELYLHSIMLKKFFRLNANYSSNETIGFLEGLIDTIKVSEQDPVALQQVRQNDESLLVSYGYDGSTREFRNELHSNSLRYLEEEKLTISFANSYAEREMETVWREIVTRHEYYSDSWVPYWICLFVNRKIDSSDTLNKINLEYMIRFSSNLIPTTLRYLPSVDISKSYLLCVNLRYANMSFSNLDNSMLQNSTLTGANLFHASINKSDLSFCDLMKVNLSRVDAVGTDFHGSVLILASLRDSNLSYSNLENCNLYAADPTNAVLIGINIKNERSFEVNMGPIAMGRSIVRPMLVVLDANFSDAVIDNQEIVDYLRSHDAINVPDAIIDQHLLETALTNRGFTQEQINRLLGSV